MSSRQPITATDILDKQLCGSKLALAELSSATGSFEAPFGNISGEFKFVVSNVAPAAVAIVFQPKYRVRITDIRVLCSGTPVAAQALLFLGGNNIQFASAVVPGAPVANQRIEPASISLANSVIDGAGGETLKINSAGITDGCTIYLTFENA